MISYEAFVAQEILKSRLISSRFEILYPGSISLSPMKWDDVFGPDDAVVHAFEADKEENGRKDTRLKGDHATYRYHDDVLWSEEGEVTLHVNETMGASSLFAHNFATTDRWAPMGLGPDIRKVQLKATTVAKWASREGIGDLDFARLNVEGAELAILNGMGPFLDRIVAMVVEVNFIPNYLTGAPVFSDVDLFMRRQGFTLFRFVDNGVHVGRRASPLTEYQRSACFPPGGQGRQLIQEHALYLRDPIAEFPNASMSQSWSMDKTLKLAFWADLHGQTDFAFEVLAWLRDGAEERQTKLAIQHVIDAATQRFESFARNKTAIEIDIVSRLQTSERRLTTEVESQSRTIETQAAQIERMHAAYVQLLRTNLALSGISSDGGV